MQVAVLPQGRRFDNAREWILSSGGSAFDSQYVTGLIQEARPKCVLAMCIGRLKQK